MALRDGVFGLVGYPLGHSFSLEIQKHFNLINYELFSLNELEFEEFLSLKAFDGINVTIPYKEKVIKFCDELSEAALAIGSVNTVINRNGILYGDNTDYLGMQETLDYFDINLTNKDVLILCTGRTSKTASYIVKQNKARSITFVSRNKKEGAISYQDIRKHNASVLINTTPVGMSPINHNSPLLKEDLLNIKVVIDVVYNPLKTKLILDALSLNILAYNGLLMLISQAYYATKLFINEPLSKDLIYNTYHSLLKEKTNLVLIGMPGSGKTTIARKLSFKKEVVDLDELISLEANLSIDNIFKNYGEPYFRKLESKIVEKISQNNSQIIATGGGVILNEANISSLRQNGLIFYLKRPLNLLQLDYNRPLVQDTNALSLLYHQRKELYEEAADIIIDEIDLENIVLQIKEKWDEYFSN